MFGHLNNRHNLGHLEDHWLEIGVSLLLHQLPSKADEVNLPGRKQLYLNNMETERAKDANNLYIEVERHKLDKIDRKKHKKVCRETYSFLEV